jgi:hypothetical protein
MIFFFKGFNLLFSPLPTRGSGKEKKTKTKKKNKKKSFKIVGGRVRGTFGIVLEM